MKREWFRVGMGILVLVALFSLVGLGQPVAPKGIIIEPPDASGLSVRIWVDKGAYTVGETIQVHFEVNEDAYVYLDDIDAAGRVTRLFPNQYSSNNFVRAGEHVLPDLATYKLTVTDPTGTEYLQIIATKRQLDALPGFQLSVPFPLFGGDPETFKLKIEGQIMGIIPEPQWTQDWTSFEVVSGDAPAYGTLIVNSVPSGAWIALDGAYVGYTSRTLYIRQGYHQVVISKEGYRDWRRAVFIIGGLTRIINATLEPSPSVNQPPVASFAATPGFSTWIHFDASASYDPDGTIVSYSWDFGDRSSGTGVSEWHRYTAPGTYTVTLTVTDDDGATDTEVRTVQVGPTNQPPVASFTVSPPSPGIGEWVRFDASASYDSDGSITSYSWDFGDRSTGAGVSEWHRYTAPGTYTVTLTVTDDDGATDTEIRTVQVGPTNQSPVASFTVSPPSPGIGEWVRFDASASYDSDGSITSYSWDFGDRTSGTGVSEWHRYSAPGTYTVTLTVTDDDGATDTEVRTVQVGPTNQPPVASFTVSPPSPGIGEWVRFDASASYDSDGSITSYSWDFGDRTSGTGVSEWHRYTAPGTYTVTLTVTDDEGATDTEVRAVQVGPTNQPPVASFTVSPPSPVIGEQIVLNATSSYDPDGTIVSHFWDLDGDGSDDTSGQIAHVRYYSAGIARVRLTVVDNTGLSSTVTQQITVGGGGGVPGGPPMGGNPGIFVWGTNTWHVTVNAGSTWTSPRSYRLELHTDGNFQNVNQSTSSGVAPLGIVPTPTEGGKALLFEGNLQSGSVDYTFSVSNAKSIWMSLKLDMDGDGDLEESPSFVYLRYAMVHPPAAPFVVGLPKGSSGPLVPSTNFRIGRALQYTSAVRFIMWLTDIATLEGY